MAIIRGLPRGHRHRLAAVRSVKSNLPTQEYVVVKEGFLMGTWRSAGSVVRLNERQAKYPLLHGHIEK